MPIFFWAPHCHNFTGTNVKEVCGAPADSHLCLRKPLLSSWRCCPSFICTHLLILHFPLTHPHTDAAHTFSFVTPQINLAYLFTWHTGMRYWHHQERNTPWGSNKFLEAMQGGEEDNFRILAPTKFLFFRSKWPLSYQDPSRFSSFSHHHCPCHRLSFTPGIFPFQLMVICLEDHIKQILINFTRFFV